MEEKDTQQKSEIVAKGSSVIDDSFDEQNATDQQEQIVEENIQNIEESEEVDDSLEQQPTIKKKKSRITRLGWMVTIACLVVTIVSVISLSIWYVRFLNEDDEAIQKEILKACQFIENWYRDVETDDVLPAVFINELQMRSGGEDRKLTSVGTNLRAEYKNGQVMYCSMDYISVSFDMVKSKNGSIHCIFTDVYEIEFRYEIKPKAQHDPANQQES